MWKWLLKNEVLLKHQSFSSLFHMTTRGSKQTHELKPAQGIGGQAERAEGKLEGQGELTKFEVTENIDAALTYTGGTHND